MKLFLALGFFRRMACPSSQGRRIRNLNGRQGSHGDSLSEKTKIDISDIKLYTEYCRHVQSDRQGMTQKSRRDARPATELEEPQHPHKSQQQIQVQPRGEEVASARARCISASTSSQKEFHFKKGEKGDPYLKSRPSSSHRAASTLAAR
ncbi:hypothetical protein BKA80DRAFT_23482 [Phyllosticta citrichinensis]